MNNLFIEIGSCQLAKSGNNICGDKIITKKIPEQNRYITVLSDGLGSGIKARVLADLTASMAMHYAQNNEPIERASQIILNTLPIDSQKNIGYSTFTIVDVHLDGLVNITEFDNPSVQIFKENNPIILERKSFVVQGFGIRRSVYTYSFIAKKEDRIIVMSDGVTQSGLGSRISPFGWGDTAVSLFIKNITETQKTISAAMLSKLILEKAKTNDNHKPQDDTSCTVIYLREPRNIVICTGPPFNEESDKKYAYKLSHYKGEKVICGGTTAQIISRELNIKIKVNLNSKRSDLPPSSSMEGIDLVTEGILTLSRACELLATDNMTEEGPAGDLVRLLIAHDKIDFMIGTRINASHYDPNLPIELEVRRNVAHKLANILETKYFKDFSFEFF